MSFGNWLKDMLYEDATEGPEQSPKQASSAELAALRAANPGKLDTHKVDPASGALRVWNWDEYVSFALQHLKKGGSFSPYVRRLNRAETDVFFRREGKDPFDMGHLVPGAPREFELYDHMLEEICLQLRRDGLTFPRDQIVAEENSVHSFNVKNSEDRSDDPFGRKSAYTSSPLISLLDHHEKGLDRQAERLGEEQLMEIADIFWRTSKNKVRLRPATEADYLDYLANHVEAGGKIASLSKYGAPYMGTTGRFDEPGQRAAMRRMGVDPWENATLVAEADGWINPAYGSGSVDIICKPGVDFDKPGHGTLYVPGQDRAIAVPECMIVDLYKLLGTRGITITEDHLAEKMDPAIKKQLLALRPNPPAKTSAPAVAPAISVGPR